MMLLYNFFENKPTRTFQYKRNHRKIFKTEKSGKADSKIADFSMIFPKGSIFELILTFF